MQLLFALLARVVGSGESVGGQLPVAGRVGIDGLARCAIGADGRLPAGSIDGRELLDPGGSLDAREDACARAPRDVRRNLALAERDEQLDGPARALRTLGDERAAPLTERHQQRRAIEHLLRGEERRDGVGAPPERDEGVGATDERAPLDLQEEPGASEDALLVETSERLRALSPGEQDARLEVEPREALRATRLLDRGLRLGEAILGPLHVAGARLEGGEVAEREAPQVRVGAARIGERGAKHRTRVPARAIGRRLVREEISPAEVVRDLEALAALHLGVTLERLEDRHRFGRASDDLHLEGTRRPCVARETAHAEARRATLRIAQEMQCVSGVARLRREDPSVIGRSRRPFGIRAESARHAVEGRACLLVAMAALVQREGEGERVVDLVGEPPCRAMRCDGGAEERKRLVCATVGESDACQ